jgi:Spx/MgsR family transcriptional regulator
MSSKVHSHLKLYGLRSCDTCRRALRWLEKRGVPHTFHDVRELGLSRSQLESWLESEYGDRLLNRRSTTWRQLSAAEKQAAERDPASAIGTHPTLLKRPVIADGDVVVGVGFDASSLEGYA